MQGREDADALLLGKLPCLLHDQLLIGHIQIARRLIEDHESGLLGHGPGDGDLLLLAAGERLGAAAGIALKAHVLQDLFNGLHILLAGLHAEIGHTAHEDRIQHDQISEVDMLGHIGHPSCPVPAAHLLQVFSVEADGALPGLLDAQDILEEGGLAGAVLAQQDAHLALLQF